MIPSHLNNISLAFSRLGLILSIIASFSFSIHPLGSQYLGLISSFLLLLMYPTRFFFKTEKHLHDIAKLILVVSFSITPILSLLGYNDLDETLRIFYKMAIVFWLVTIPLYHYRFKRYPFPFDNKMKISRSMYFSVSAYMLAVLFKLLHLPYADLFIMLTSLFLLIDWALKNLPMLANALSQE